MALSDREVNVFQDLLLINFQQLSLPFINKVHSYIPATGMKEPDPGQILDWLTFCNPGMEVAHPVINSSDSTMKNYLCNENTVYELNQYGIP